MISRERESKLCQDIHRRRENLDGIVNQLQGGNSMIRGSIYVRRRRCGKPRCRCVDGHLHEDRVLAVVRAGRASVRVLDPMEDAATENAVDAWRQFRRCRGELIDACQGLVQAVDRLGRLREVKRRIGQ